MLSLLDDAPSLPAVPLKCGAGSKFLGSFMLIPISISGVNKPLQLRLMRLYHGEGSSEVGWGGLGWMIQSPSSWGVTGDGGESCDCCFKTWANRKWWNKRQTFNSSTQLPALCSVEWIIASHRGCSYSYLNYYCYFRAHLPATNTHTQTSSSLTWGPCAANPAGDRWADREGGLIKAGCTRMQ